MAYDKTSEFIDELIIDCLSQKNASFDDVFLYVGRKFPINTRQGGCSVPPRFYFLVENRMKSLKRKGFAFYDRKLGCWCLNQGAIQEGHGETAISA
jgi:hypothetical protein